ncbi:chitobiase/beta-hexosaminidase C-terminal domain-containing protein [Staphylococcus aureus]|uniref:chitobiase/beta-hexosaminidase C-terminal domain-containing protein n=1 Tax=Staphylococcus aureus TaxID=1280 RepID=UPI0020BFD01C|nr:chitobiase/beta-hexosaminidase C-terminal domain-containing protein [Staphylococcus aureus]
MGYEMMNGLTAASPKSLMIGPGIITKNFNPQTFDPADVSTWGEKLGATKGGNTVTLDTEWHNVEVDGALGDVAGMRWLIKAEAKATTNLLEVTKENLLMKLNTFGVSSFSDVYDKIGHNGSVAPSPVTNIAIFGAIIGKNVPVVVVLENAQSTDSTEIPLGNGKDDVVLKAEFGAQFSPAEPTKIPFYILYPKGGATLAAPTASPAPGTFTSAQTVTLTGANGTKVYYTLDGSYPTPLNGIEYTAPIQVDESVTINAVAVKDADTSAPVGFTYTINV